MTLFERLARIFRRTSVPEEARRVYETSRSTDELIVGLEQVLGRNRIEYDLRSRELRDLANLLDSQRTRLRDETLAPADEDWLMDQIDIYEPQRSSLRSSVGYLKTNMRVLFQLIGQIRERQARELRGVSEDDIDGILESVSEDLHAWERDMAAAGEIKNDTVDEQEVARQREERKRRLLGESSAATPAAPVRDQAVRQPRKPETE